VYGTAAPDANAQSAHSHMFFHHLPPTSPRNYQSTNANVNGATEKGNAHVAAYMQDRQGFAEDLPTFVGGVQGDVVFRSQVFSKRGPADGQFER
jgi:hypothetical protein